MGINIDGLGTVPEERWERPDPHRPDDVLVRQGDSTFAVCIKADGTGTVSIDMSYGRWGWLVDYIESVGASELLYRHHVERDPDDHLAYGHVHEIDARAVADALDTEIRARRHRLYCDAHPSKDDPNTGSLEAEDITRLRDFLRVCGGYCTW